MRTNVTRFVKKRGVKEKEFQNELDETGDARPNKKNDTKDKASREDLTIVVVGWDCIPQRL